VLTGVPVVLNTTMGFYSSYSGRSEASSYDFTADATLRRQFEAMKIADTECIATVKSVSCAVINSAQRRLKSTPRQCIWIMNLLC
jgi:hypothetical protein